jgi:hypothetical protein
MKQYRYRPHRDLSPLNYLLVTAIAFGSCVLSLYLMSIGQ